MKEKNKKRLKTIFDQALTGTIMNYPSFDLSGTIAYEIMKKIEAYKKMGKYLDTYTCISFNNWLEKGLEENDREIYETILIYAKYLENYPKKTSEEKIKYNEDLKEYIDNKDIIYDLSNMIINYYIMSLDPSIVFESVLKTEQSKSLYQFLTNVENYKLMDSYSGRLLEGKIQMTTNRGYKKDKERPQQDALLSMVRKEDLFLNVIADGVGASNVGDVVSREIILKMKDWFENENEEIFENLKLTVELLKEKLNEINSEVNKKYENSYSTVVLALTVKDKTIILSVGDSTAYTYENEKLILLNKLDSHAKGSNYEEARRSIQNNVITAAIGAISPVHPHITIIDNKGQRIILSSDGVTDLVSDKTFISYFKNKSSSDKIVDDALNNPEIMYEINYDGITEVHYLPKTEDNISAVVVDLPNKKLTKHLDIGR